MMSQERRRPAPDRARFFNLLIVLENKKAGTGSLHSGPRPAGGIMGSVAGKTGYNCRKVYQNHYDIVNMENEESAMLCGENAFIP